MVRSGCAEEAAQKVLPTLLANSADRRVIASEKACEEVGYLCKSLSQRVRRPTLAWRRSQWRGKGRPRSRIHGGIVPSKDDGAKRISGANPTAIYAVAADLGAARRPRKTDTNDVPMTVRPMCLLIVPSAPTRI